MNRMCDRYSIDIVGLKKPTALDKLAETIPKPKGAIPNFGLPKWKVMPLESKIPMVPGPEGAYNFTRRKIGEQLWISAPDTEFNLSDPYGYEIKWTYDSLHDKHLVPYFSRPNIVRHLIKAGFVTKNLDAKCSLRDYNMYRRYLRRLHCDSVKKELNRRANLSIEERALQYAEEQAQKEVKRLEERDRLMELRRSVIRENEMAEKLKLRKQKEKQLRIEERLRALNLRKQEALRLQRVKSKARAELIRQKQKAAADIRREKIIQTLLEWSNKEHVRKKMMDMRLAYEREHKRKLVKQKWEERQEFQKKQIEMKQFLLQCMEDQRKEFIEAYKGKVNRETKRMKKLFQETQMYVKCYLARRLAKNREQRICCKKYFHDDEDETAALSVKGTENGFKSKPYESSIQKKQDKQKIKKMFEVKKKRRKVKDVTKPKLTQKMKKKKLTLEEKIKEQKIVKIKKTGKKRRRKAKKQKDTESETKSELETIPESIPSTSTKTSEGSSTSGVKDNCRCQIIKDSKRALIS